MSKSKYVGVKGGSIKIVTSGPFKPSDPEIEVVPVPAEFHDMFPAQIITGFRVRNGHLRARRIKKSTTQKMKLAFVGNWKMQCGIATYSENLLPEVSKHFGDFKLFIEKNDSPTGPVNLIGNDVLIGTDRVISCWKRGEPLQELVAAIKEYDPDIVWIQHEFGIWSNAGAWLSMMSQLADYRVIVTMHSVFHHRDKTIVEAAMPEIIVHLEGAKTVLKDEKGINSPVHVIPHGCAPVMSSEKLWNFYKSTHTFMQFGFGFRYKGWEKSIRAAAILREKYPDVFFTGLFSESPFNMVDHQVYYDELIELVEKLDLTGNVAIIRGYQSDAALDSYLRTNQAVVFPYVSHPAHEVFGVSGAARYAMSKMVPVITTDVNHFSDVPTIKADTPEEIAAALDSMFSSQQARKMQVQSQLQYLTENTWEKVAMQHVQLFGDDPRK
jgi:glycosyltransferase involved in cell wall biosynthesis